MNIRKHIFDHFYLNSNSHPQSHPTRFLEPIIVKMHNLKIQNVFKNCKNKNKTFEAENFQICCLLVFT